MIILGIDPGLRFSGYGVMKKEQQKIFLLECGFLRLKPTDSLSDRIGIFYQFFTDKIATWSVSHIALETPFLGKNAQNFLKLGYLRGIVHLITHQQSLVLHEFSPTEIKQAVTGFGGAGKDQVARVVLQLFPKLNAPQKQDVTDAIAITLCGLWRNNSLRYR